MLKGRLHNKLIKRRGALAIRRLGRDQRGVALVETIFATALLTFFLIVIAQLYYISDLAAYTMAAAHRQATKEIHEMDDSRKFTLRHEVEVEESIPLMPGMRPWLRHFELDDLPLEYTIKRRVMLAGGSYTGIGHSIYTWIDPFCKHKAGKRVTSVMTAFATELDISQWSAPVWEMLLNYIVDELIWEAIMHVLDYYLPPGTPDWIKEMIAKELKKMIDQMSGGDYTGQG